MDTIPISALFVVLALLILLSAFFSGSETALMTLNRYRLRHLAESGNTGAIRARNLLKKPDRLIGLILLGNNFVNILASSIATVIALRLGGEGAIALSTGLLTLVVLLFAEVAPKTFGALHPEKMAFPAAAVYRPLLLILYPLVWLINLIANFLLKLLGISTDHKHSSRLSTDELRTVVKEADAMVTSDHQNMLLGLLDLEQATVEDIMVPRLEIVGVDIDVDAEDLQKQLLNAPYTRMLLYHGDIDHIIGMVHMKRAMKKLILGELNINDLQAMAAPPYFIPEGTPLNRQLLNFQREKRRLALVVDEYGDLQGLVTLEDLLEEVVGEFTTDPGSDANSMIQAEDNDSFILDGSANVKDIVRIKQWHLPTNGPKTMNGLILEYMETIPETGTSLRLYGYPIEILQVQDNMVKSLRIFPQLYKTKA
ncbi:MAG: HlyC/CorC family transporter [gamma proteobacterium symbiont of Bathyaustriella thionipta]|nr:HlyC/CorC family transporter [gamma proteobacterium symbiont of Bathyaustriella thionipta]